MKMVKSLLLVSAAGIVAASGAQAADLPVKAKPVEYVKVCSLYGAGFYYMPGTDICLKVGGYVRYQVNYGSGSSISSGPFIGIGGFNNRISNDDVAQRVRALATFDSRQQTAYGTLRTYLLLGYSQDTSAFNPTTAPALYATRGFIQIAGFTFGKATSFFDFISSAAVAYNAGFTHSPDTGDGGQIVGSYTAQLGNGVSATIGIEQSRRQPTVYSAPNLGGVAAPGAFVNPFLFTMATPTPDNLGGQSASGFASLPDIVANVRIDQAWGSAQLSGALHNVSAAYYGNTAPLATGEGNGHPGEKWGWAISPGLRLNAPMFGPGDYFQTAFVYAQGATKYASNTPSGTGAANSYWIGNQFSFGFFEDAVFTGTATGAPGTLNVGGNSLHLTTAWSVFASYEHFWTPSLRTSLYGSAVNVSHDTTSNLLICGSLASSTGTAGATAGCNSNFSIWNVGSRSQWNVTKDFYVGIDVIYQKFNSATFNGGAPFAITAAGTAPGNGKPANSIYQTTDHDAVSVTWRVHRDILP